MGSYRKNIKTKRGIKEQESTNVKILIKFEKQQLIFKKEAQWLMEIVVWSFFLKLLILLFLLLCCLTFFSCFLFKKRFERRELAWLRP